MKTQSHFQIMVLLVFALIVFVAIPARADKLHCIDGAGGGGSFSFENDMMGVASTDRHYTNGLRLAFVTCETPASSSGEGERSFNKTMEDTGIPRFLGFDTKRISLNFGQNMFTPENIVRRDLIVTDRPYAGWFYAGLGFIKKDGESLNLFQFDMGVVGPHSLAENAQIMVHNWRDLTTPKGWDNNQIKNEVAFVGYYQKKWRHGSDHLDFLPHLGGALGTVYTYLNGGFAARVGMNLKSDYGAPTIRPGAQGSDFFVPSKDLTLYVYAGVEGRAVARNIFLDGNTFTGSHHVDKIPFVGDMQMGFVIGYEQWRITFANVVRSKEFYDQRATDNYGAITLSWVCS